MADHSSDEPDGIRPQAASQSSGGSFPRQVLAALIEQRRPQLLAFIERNMSDRLRLKIDPADVLQETAVSALETAATLELGARDPFSWLCQVAERRIIDAHRRYFAAEKRSAQREQSLQQPGANDSSCELAQLLIQSMTTPSAAFARHEREHLLQQALEELPELSREVLRLRFVEELATKQIAQRLGKSDGAIRVLLTRTLQRVGEQLGGVTWFQGE